MNSNSQPVWPQRAPVFRLIGMLLSLVLGLLFLRIWFVRSAAPLERFLFPDLPPLEPVWQLQFGP